MKIAIEALGIHYVGGGRTAIMTLFESLFEIDHENEYLIFLTQPEATLSTPKGNVTQVIAPVRNRFLLRVWAQIVLPLKIRRFDIVHFTKNLGLAGISAKTIVTVHDLTTVFYPDLFNRFDVWYWRNVEPRTLQTTKKILAVSQTTARDVIDYYHIPPERVEVIYNALPDHFIPADDAEIQRIRNKYQISQPYFIHVGRIDRKKNLSFLVESFNHFLLASQKQYQLVLVGESYKNSPDLDLLPTIERLNLQDSVILTGRAPDEDLPGLNSGAQAAIYTSHHEGFGLAPVEAMACGTPVIIHNSGAIEEVMGGSVKLLASLDHQTITDAMLEIITDENLRTELISKGKERAQSYRRQASAQQLLSIYEEVHRSIN